MFERQFVLIVLTVFVGLLVFRATVAISSVVLKSLKMSSVQCDGRGGISTTMELALSSSLGSSSDTKWLSPTMARKIRVDVTQWLMSIISVVKR